MMGGQIRAKKLDLRALPDINIFRDATTVPNRDMAELEAARLALAEAEDTIRQQEARIRELFDLALTDELTGALNRRGFTVALQREIAMARRDKGAQGALLMFDLDGFKSVNDSWGHSAGDHYLKVAVETLRACSRDHDCVARLGGDEFALILSRINKKDALRRAEEIGRDFNCQIVEWGGFAVPLRGSFGIALYGNASLVDDVMAEADAKLYAHKAQKNVR